jgi:hypothetical protein
MLRQGRRWRPRAIGARPLVVDRARRCSRAPVQRAVRPAPHIEQ